MDIARGFDLVGETPISGVLPKKFFPAQIPLEQLQAQSLRSATAIRYMTGTTLWMHRFGRRRKRKLIMAGSEDPFLGESCRQAVQFRGDFPYSKGPSFTQSQVNSTVSSFEQPTVDNPDVVCAIKTYLVKMLGINGRCSKLVARSLDLASAYRQRCILSESLRYSFLSVFNPTDGTAALFQQIALPFGSRTAVNAFIRCARFLHCSGWQPGA